MQRIVGLLVVLCVTAALGWSFQVREKQQIGHAPIKSGVPSLENVFREMRAAIRANFEQVAADLNAQAAEHADAPFRLSRAEVGDGPSMIYYYTLAGGETLPDEQTLLARLAASGCTVPEMRDYMEYGVSYIFVYSYEQSGEFRRLRLDDNVCKAYAASTAQAARDAVPAATPKQRSTGGTNGRTTDSSGYTGP